MEYKNIIHDGVSIKIYETEDDNKVVIRFTDAITAFSLIKKAVIGNKGMYCNGIAAILSKYLQTKGIPTHYIEKLSDTEQLCHKAKVIPLEVIVRNVIAGSLSRKLGIKDGRIPAIPIYDLCYKSDSLGDPLINDYQAIALEIVTEEELGKIYDLAKRINETLIPLFKSIGITLVDYKIEFGYLPDGTLALTDDITPDSARLWDISTGEVLDKDRFRHDRGKVGEAYKTVYERLGSIDLS